MKSSETQVIISHCLSSDREQVVPALHAAWPARAPQPAASAAPALGRRGRACHHVMMVSCAIGSRWVQIPRHGDPIPCQRHARGTCRPTPYGAHNPDPSGRGTEAPWKSHSRAAAGEWRALLSTPAPPHAHTHARAREMEAPRVEVGDHRVVLLVRRLRRKRPRSPSRNDSQVCRVLSRATVRTHPSTFTRLGTTATQSLALRARL
eukprot:SAG25_NODE_44_length_19254_cov_246.998121_8_plen_206_part_00